MTQRRRSLRAAGVVRDVQRTVRPFGQTDRTVSRSARVMVTPREPVDEHVEPWTGCLRRERQMDDVESVVGTGPIPRTVECDEGAAIPGREHRPGVEEQTVRRPVRREGEDRQGGRRAAADRAPVASVLGRDELLPPRIVVVAVRPPVVLSLRQPEHLLGGEPLARFT
jgi:hypothetical protein